LKRSKTQHNEKSPAVVGHSRCGCQHEGVSNFIFGEFSDQELDEFLVKLEALKNPLEKASLKVSMGI
jgi:hypothetical protein